MYIVVTLSDLPERRRLTHMGYQERNRAWGEGVKSDKGD